MLQKVNFKQNIYILNHGLVTKFSSKMDVFFLKMTYVNTHSFLEGAKNRFPNSLPVNFNLVRITNKPDKARVGMCTPNWSTHSSEMCSLEYDKHMYLLIQILHW